jgi:hypothetical protein
MGVDFVATGTASKERSALNGVVLKVSLLPAS